MTKSHLIDEAVWYKDIGSRIKKARKELGLTQEEVARKANLQRTSITNIEKALQKTPIYTLYVLSVVLKKPMQELLPDINEDTKVILGGKESVMSPKAKNILDELLGKKAQP